jgi:hypothetical protein
VFRRNDLVKDGLPRPEVEALCGEALRIRRGLYVPKDGDPKTVYTQRYSAALAAVKPGAALAGPTAAFHWGIPMVDVPDEIVLRGLSRGKYAGGVRALHGEAEYTLHDGVPVTTPAWTVIDCARLLSRRDGLIVADAALHEGLCSMDQLWDTLRGAGSLRGITRARWVVANADPASESPGETWTRMVLRDLGYDVTSQFHVHDGEFHAYVDLMIDGTRLGLEFDGAVKYRGEHKKQAENAVLREKIRQGRLEELLYDILRVVWGQLSNPAALDRRIRSKGVVPRNRPRAVAS